MRELSLLTKQKKLPLATSAMRNEKYLQSFILGNKNAFHDNVVKKTVDGKKSSSLFCQNITLFFYLKPSSIILDKMCYPNMELGRTIRGNGEGDRGGKV